MEYYENLLKECKCIAQWKEKHKEMRLILNRLRKDLEIIKR